VPEQVANDYHALRLSLKAHPLSLLRARLDRKQCIPSARLTAVKSGSKVKLAGLVITRQRPGSANGVMFITLEDETGHANLIIWPTVFERFRQAVLGATMMGVEGPVQREGTVIHVVARRVWNLGSLLGELTDSARPDRAADEAKFDVQSRDFH
jgi:error-prone DNA polymerase